MILNTSWMYASVFLTKVQLIKALCVHVKSDHKHVIANFLFLCVCHKHNCFRVGVKSRNDSRCRDRIKQKLSKQTFYAFLLYNWQYKKKKKILRQSNLLNDMWPLLLLVIDLFNKKKLIYICARKMLVCIPSTLKIQ